MTKLQRQEAKRQRARMKAVGEACQDEIGRFNQALSAGAKVIINTAFGMYRVHSVNHDFWYKTSPFNQAPSFTNQRSFCGCNDGQWADMMQQAGVLRNPLFKGC